MYGQSSTGFSPYQGGYPGSSQTPTSYPGQHAVGRGYSGIQVKQGALMEAITFSIISVINLM